MSFSLKGSGRSARGRKGHDVETAGQETPISIQEATRMAVSELGAREDWVAEGRDLRTTQQSWAGHHCQGAHRRENPHSPGNQRPASRVTLRQGHRVHRSTSDLSMPGIAHVAHPFRRSATSRSRPTGSSPPCVSDEGAADSTSRSGVLSRARLPSTSCEACGPENGPHSVAYVRFEPLCRRGVRGADTVEGNASDIWQGLERYTDAG